MYIHQFNIYLKSAVPVENFNSNCACYIYRFNLTITDRVFITHNSFITSSYTCCRWVNMRLFESFLSFLWKQHDSNILSDHKIINLSFPTARWHYLFFKRLFFFQSRFKSPGFFFQLSLINLQTEKYLFLVRFFLLLINLLIKKVIFGKLLMTSNMKLYLTQSMSE